MSPATSMTLSSRLKQRPSALGIITLMLIWVFLWGDFTIGNFLAGFALAWFVSLILPLPRMPRRKKAFRPIAFARLVLIFIKDVGVAATQIAGMAMMNKQPQGAVIRVQLRSHSDVFLTATAGMVSLVPGSFVVDVHRLTGTLYLHIFDLDMIGGLEAAHLMALDQEERILRALASDEELIDAGYVPGGSLKLGRLPGEEELDDIVPDRGEPA